MKEPTAIGRRVLITGGAGFIGHRLAAALGAANDVLIVDDLSVGMPMPLAGAQVAAERADVRDSQRMLGLFEQFRPDTVIHLAAIHHIPTCEQQRTLALSVNVLGTETLLDAAEKTGVGMFVLASSGAVYEWVDGALDEQSTALRAADNYALSKLTNERQVAFWADRTGRKARIARIFNTIGHDDPNAHLIPDIMMQIARAPGVATIELGNTAPRRDYIHADDTALGIAAIAGDTRDVAVDTFNVCSGVETSVADLVHVIGRAMDKEIRIAEVASRRRRVDRMSQLGNPMRARDNLAWSARRTLENSIADIVRNFDYAAAEAKRAR